jgi:hypothetical protein
MADNVSITSGSGTTIAADDVGGGVLHQRVKVTWGPDGTGNDADTASGMALPVQLRDSTGNAVRQKFVTVSTDVTRPADTTAYAINDALSDDTATPTAGGFTFSSIASASGGSGIITDAMVCSSNDPATPLQGEVFIFDTSVTEINDNAAFAVSDTEIKTLVGIIPFTLTDVGNNDAAWISNLNIGFTCSGSANLRFLVRVKNAYTPASGEVLTFRVKALQID